MIKIIYTNYLIKTIQIIVAADMLAVRENKRCLSFWRNQQNDKCGNQDGWSNWPSTLAASALSIHIL